MFVFLWIITISIANYLRGRGELKIVSEHFTFGAVIFFTSLSISLWQKLPDPYVFSAIVALGMLNWSIWAWDKNGFPIFNKTDTRDYSQNRIILPIVEFLTGFKKRQPLSPDQCVRWGEVFFSVRGTCLAPLLIAISAYYRLPWPLFLLPITTMQGGCYMIGAIQANSARKVMYSEIIWGAVMGWIIGLASYMII